MRQLNRQSEIENQKCDCQGGDSNSRPTPKAFGAALLSHEMKNGDLWVFFCFEETLDFPRLLERWNFFLCHDPKRPTQSSGCGSMSPKVLSKPRLDIDRGADIMAARRSLEDVNPRHKDLPEGRIELPTKGL